MIALLVLLAGLVSAAVAQCDLQDATNCANVFDDTAPSCGAALTSLQTLETCIANADCEDELGQLATLNCQDLNDDEACGLDCSGFPADDPCASSLEAAGCILSLLGLIGTSTCPDLEELYSSTQGCLESIDCFKGSPRAIMLFSCENTRNLTDCPFDCQTLESIVPSSAPTIPTTTFLATVSFVALLR